MFNDTINRNDQSFNDDINQDIVSSLFIFGPLSGPSDEENYFGTFGNEGNNLNHINNKRFNIPKFIPINDETNNSSIKKTISQSKSKIENKNINNIQKNNSINENKQNDDDFKKEYIDMKKELKFYLDNKRDYEIKEEKNLLGRKRKNSEKMGKHNKFDDDNLIQKIERTLMSNILDNINTTLKKNIKKLIKNY